MKIIEITIAADGTTKLETRGFQGPECQQASKDFLAALGTATKETKTADFYGASNATASQDLKQ